MNIARKRALETMHEEIAEVNPEEAMKIRSEVPPFKKAKILKHRKRKNTNLSVRTQFVKN